MHFEQVLVDWKKFRILNLFDKVDISHGARDVELLFRVFVLLHVKDILDFQVALDKQPILILPERVDKA